MTDRFLDAPAHIIDELTRRLRATVEDVVPWFYAQMPRTYFQDTARETQLSHLMAILATRASGLPTKVILRNDDDSEWTFIDERDYPGLLAELLTQIPRTHRLRSAKVHTTADDKIVLDVFRFGTDDGAADRDDPEIAAKRAEVLAMPHDDAAGLPLERFVAQCSADFLRTVTPYRVMRSWQLCRELARSDDTAVAFDQEELGWRLSVASGNADPRDLFERVTRRISAHGLDIQRAHLDVFELRDAHRVVLASFIVRAVGGESPEELAATRARLGREVARVRWLDDRALVLAQRHAALDLTRAELLAGLLQLIHPALADADPYAYSLERIEAMALRHLPETLLILDAFLARFDPGAGAVALPLCDIAARIDQRIGDPLARRVARQLLKTVDAVSDANISREHRFGLALLFDPAELGMPQPETAPYAGLFVHGRQFVGFHLRFRDIARGGLRVVRPRGPEQHVLERERLYHEVYQLAFAQQLKNKDIPEGGAKAVVLAEPGAVVADCVKAFADGVLDLVTAPPGELSGAASAQARERIYLGPDENITPALIEWIVDRAERRGYPSPGAFMSSKPGAGINHKQYGVTSEGVIVFLEQALRAVGIDPRTQPFTVKLTGGPDGDVGGNAIKILAREFGDHVRVVGVADGSGCAEDPDGLAMDELLRLVAASAPITGFSRERLGARGVITTVDQDGGSARRDDMFLRVVADAFVPAGGRPATLHEGNWRAYVHDGVASSKVIIEGANLFLTPAARMALAREAGVVIVKDSSANKCGVICSSYEICASMLLSTAELLAIKEPFVRQVTERLRQLARREAVLLFREWDHHPELALPELSVRVSELINRACDAIEPVVGALATSEPALYHQLIVEHLPPVLLEHAGGRIAEQVPQAYVRRIAATVLATRIVYREGIDYLWQLASERIGELALRYLRREQEIAALIDEVASAALPSRDRIVELLREGGPRAALARGDGR